MPKPHELTASNGVIVVIHEDMCATPGSNEEKRIIEQQRRVAREILKRYRGGEQK